MVRVSPHCRTQSLDLIVRSNRSIDHVEPGATFAPGSRVARASPGDSGACCVVVCAGDVIDCAERDRARDLTAPSAGPAGSRWLARRLLPLQACQVLYAALVDGDVVVGGAIARRGLARLGPGTSTELKGAIEPIAQMRYSRRTTYPA